MFGKNKKSDEVKESDLINALTVNPEEKNVSGYGEICVTDAKIVAADAPVKKENSAPIFPAEELGNLLNESAETVIDKSVFDEIKRFMKRVGKVTVRYAVSEKDFLCAVKNCKILSVSEILAAPTYLDGYKKAVNKSGVEGQKISALIDFPFGESLFKSKITDIKNCLKYGVDGFVVVMPVASVNTGEFKSQIKKIGKITSRDTGVAFSAGELSEEDVKTILKAAEKSEVKSVTFVFGDATEQIIREKAAFIKKYRGKKEIRILGNVLAAEGVAILTALGADKVFTPYADEIGKELVSRFKIKCVNLC